MKKREVLFNHFALCFSTTQQGSVSFPQYFINKKCKIFQKSPFRDEWLYSGPLWTQIFDVYANIYTWANKSSRSIYLKRHFPVARVMLKHRSFFLDEFETFFALFFSQYSKERRKSLTSKKIKISVN